MITKNPPAGERNPKKTADHATFNRIWHAKANIASRLPIGPLLDQIIYSDTAINKYKKFQTGANTQLGGESAGFSSCAYQVPTELAVNAPPIAPAPKQTNRQTINFGMLFMKRPPPLFPRLPIMFLRCFPFLLAFPSKNQFIFRCPLLDIEPMDRLH